MKIVVNDEPNPPLWSTSVKIFRPTDDIEWMQKELYSTQDPQVYRTNDTNPTATTTVTALQQQPMDISSLYFTCHAHFSRRRMALLFAPGQYHNLRFEIGYYVQILGLGRRVQDVQFVSVVHNNNNHSNIGTKEKPNFVGPYVPALNKLAHVRNNQNKEIMSSLSAGTSLDSFWRAAENFTISAIGTTTTTTATSPKADMLWAASQAAPLRRIHITGDLYLHDHAAYASGGHCTDTQIDGTLYLGGQQQYLFRHVHVGTNVCGGAWSMVYVGCTGNVPTQTTTTTGTTSTSRNTMEVEEATTTQSTNDLLVVTVVDQPRVRVEKPYIVMKIVQDAEQYELRVPKARWSDDMTYTVDPMLKGADDDDDDDCLEAVRDFSQIRVVRDDEPISRIQDALDEGKDVVLCPGIFSLVTSIIIRHPNQILYGLGLATLEAPKDGSPCICVKHLC
jgi:hypothetical protein